MNIKEFNSILSGFKLDAECVNVSNHRHFAFYDLKLGPKCQISKISRLAGEIALKLKSKTIPIVKPITEEGIVRLQVVNKNQESIDLCSITRVKQPGLLPVLLGETEEGQPFNLDLASNPHMLVAGSTGSGKSILLHNIIYNLSLIKNTKIYLSDPKLVEFSIYKNPKLSSLFPLIVSSYEETVSMLRFLVDEMENRYEDLASAGLQSIEGMKYPFDKIVVIIDEIADLILMDGKTHILENLIVKLAQKSRAAGIYLILATQRPSVEVLTGLIKANFEGRLACRVSSRIDSQVILDRPGAEHLLGRGDALFKNRNHNLVRFQVGYVNPQKTIESYAKNIL